MRPPAATRDVRRRPARGRQTPARSRPMRPEFPPSTLRSRPFTCKRFHVLSNSLFKVLFNFPSPYLFAIGLVPVFSLRWSLPPTLGCILKQPDSRERQSDAAHCRTGLTPAMGKAPIKRTWTVRQRPRDAPKHHSSCRPRGRRIRCWAHPASLAVTKGILVSFFSSAY